VIRARKRFEVKSESRTAIAYIAGRLVSGRRSSTAFDYSRSQYVNFSGSVRPGKVQVFDYETGNHISGSGSDRSLRLFEYGRGSHIQLNLNGQQFKGFDYGSGTHFMGNVNGNRVNIFDYAEGQYFNYLV
jgi:hypothetical protein